MKMDVECCCRATFEGAFNEGGRVLKHKLHSGTLNCLVKPSPAKLVGCSTKGPEEHLTEARALINSSLRL